MSLDQEERIKLIQRMRETMATRIHTAPPIPAAQPSNSLDPEAECEDLAILQRGADIYHISLNSPHKFGKLLSLARRIWRKLLKPILIRQVHYNSANARSLAVLKTQVEQLRSENQALKSE